MPEGASLSLQQSSGLSLSWRGLGVRGSGNQGAVQLWAESRQAEHKSCGWREGKGLGGLGQLTTAGLLEISQNY